jgi:hypothetical protein
VPRPVSPLPSAPVRAADRMSNGPILPNPMDHLGASTASPSGVTPNSPDVSDYTDSTDQQDPFPPEVLLVSPPPPVLPPVFSVFFPPFFYLDSCGICLCFPRLDPNAFA